jgi:hypothetical protein
MVEELAKNLPHLGSHRTIRHARACGVEAGAHEGPIAPAPGVVVWAGMLLPQRAHGERNGGAQNHRHAMERFVTVDAIDMRGFGGLRWHVPWND